jgi:Uma2 family endonuclease
LSWDHGAGRQAEVGEHRAGPHLAEDDDVAPDIVWLSNERLQTVLAADGKLHAAPELIIEVLSPGAANQRRDREAKLRLYSRRGVDEYWIVNWHLKQIEVYRHDGLQLATVVRLNEPDHIDSPLLPGFSCPLASIFDGVQTK